MNSPRPPSVPGLIRRPSPQPQPPDPPRFLSTKNHHLPSSDGVVVVGFISRRPDDSSQLINQILDSNIFGSGNTSKILETEGQDWFRFRRISYYHQVEKGIVFVQFSPTLCPAFDSSFDSVLEESEFGDLQGVLFMFSVCHVIINIQEGSRFDTHLLNKFRVLQASKQALSPFVKSRSPLPSTSRPYSSTNTSSRGGIISRGGGSYASSLLPGQCNPVMLFVFLDDYSEISKPSFTVDDSTTTTKSSGSVSKSEGGLRKKLQLSLEAQVRFLIKKCRTLSGSDINNNHHQVNSRNGAPLFTLDATKAVVLLDRSSNKKGESLDFASSLVDDVLNGKANPDSLLLENSRNIPTKEDVTCVREFVYRCSDILRGKGGLAPANSSTAGVGMVAVAAAAAAAASTGSRKTFNTSPQLPRLDEWLFGSYQILRGIITAKTVSTEGIIKKKKPRERNTSPVKEEEARSDPENLDIAVSLLRSGKGLNSKFSTLWCERALPFAKETYLRDLPECYPTLVHETHLEIALRSFLSKVRGPSVKLFAERLKEECVREWESGRQLCDAISLTGKPCEHLRHDDSVDSHSSGFVFLHACACGCSRKLRSDPFDFDSANVSFNWFQECDKLLPSVKLPEVAHIGPIVSSSWSIVRLGGSRYYEPSKGLVQSGFSSTEKFLIRTVLDASNGFLVEDSEKASQTKSYVNMARTNVEESVNNGDKKISFGRGLPNLLMRKPFSEVVAGSKTTDLLFPPLQPSRQPQEKVVKLKSRNGQSIHNDCNQETKDISKDLSLQNGPLVVYVGFEHECPYGHRFLLNTEHLAQLGSSYSVPEENHFAESSRFKSDASKMERNVVYGKGRRKSNRMRNMDRPNLAVSKDIESIDKLNNAEDFGVASSMLNRHLPVFMDCPHCSASFGKKDASDINYAGTISQLQRIFLVTPHVPVVLATCPVIQFEESCLPPTITNREQKLRFGVGCPVILPPDSFLSLRLPFVYGMQLEDGTHHPLMPSSQEPEKTAWIVKGTVLQLLTKENSLDT